MPALRSWKAVSRLVETSLRYRIAHFFCGCNPWVYGSNHADPACPVLRAFSRSCRNVPKRTATGGVGAVDARLGPGGGTLWVDESRIGAVGAFAVNGGNLTELSSSPTSLPAGAAPAGIVVT